MKVHLKHGKVTQIMHGASRNYRYVWDVSPTHHTVATIQVVEDVQTISTHHTHSPPRPINGDSTTSTIDEETSMNI